MPLFPPDPLYPRPEPETEPGIGPELPLEGPPRCMRCGKQNEYQPGPFLCWECANVWPLDDDT